MTDFTDQLSNYLGLDTKSPNDQSFVVSDVEHVLRVLVVSTILENLTPDDKRQFLKIIDEGKDNPNDSSWYEWAKEKIPKLDGIVETGIFDTLQRIKLGL